jgi:hypothetical protein
MRRRHGIINEPDFHSFFMRSNQFCNDAPFCQKKHPDIYRLFCALNKWQNSFYNTIILRRKKYAYFCPVTKRNSLRKAYILGAIFETIWTVFKLKGEPPMTRFVAVELAKDHWFDVSAAQKDLGLKPAHNTWTALDALALSYRKSK